MSCRIDNCRFKHSHTTAGHKCGTCNNYGHGQLECSKKKKKINLLKYINDKLPNELYCTVPNCKYPWSHTNASHNFKNINKNNYKVKCPYCNKIGNVSITNNKLYGLSDNCGICKDNSVEIVLPFCGHCLCIECTIEISIDKPKILKVEDKIQNSENTPDNIKDKALEIMNDINYPIAAMVYDGMGCYFYVRRKNINSDLESIFIHSDCQGQYGEDTDDTRYIKYFLDGYFLIN